MRDDVWLQSEPRWEPRRSVLEAFKWIVACGATVVLTAAILFFASGNH